MRAISATNGKVLAFNEAHSDVMVAQYCSISARSLLRSLNSFAIR
jgi:hypothetical protein